MKWAFLNICRNLGFDTLILVCTAEESSCFYSGGFFSVQTHLQSECRNFQCFQNDIFQKISISYVVSLNTVHCKGENESYIDILLIVFHTRWNRNSIWIKFLNTIFWIQILGSEFVSYGDCLYAILTSLSVGLVSSCCFLRKHIPLGEQFLWEQTNQFLPAIHSGQNRRYRKIVAALNTARQQTGSRQKSRWYQSLFP